MTIPRPHVILFIRHALIAGPGSSSCGSRSGWETVAGMILLLLVLSASALPAFAIENTASGTVNASVLDTSNARVVLNLLTGAVDPVNSSVTADPANVPADGLTVSTITVVLVDGDNQPLSGRDILITSDRGAADIVVQSLTPTDATGTAVGTIRSTMVGVATITVTDTATGIELADHPQVTFTQGQVLDLVKSANKKEVVSGDVVTYLVEIRNLTGNDVQQVSVDDLIPPGFRYIEGSARLNGTAVADPTGNRPLTFYVGTIPALSDDNGNGIADPEEAGYVSLSYQLVVGSGARPGDFVNTAVAWDAGPSSTVSNSDDARVTVVMDPLFDLGTIIGKVFMDSNGDGLQEKGEEGIPHAAVVLDDGTRAVTDKYGRYHFPAVFPGHRLVKIDRRSLPNGVTVAGDESRIVSVTPGLLVKLNFPVSGLAETKTIGRAPLLGLRMITREEKKPLEVYGSVEMMTALINGVKADLSTNDVKLRVADLDEIVTITGGRLEDAIRFQTGLDTAREVKDWVLTVLDAKGVAVHTFRGEGFPPEFIAWNGITDQGDLISGGQIFRYYMKVHYANGDYSSSAERLFGVNRKSVVSLDISGVGFELGSATLRPATKKILSRAAETFRAFPEEIIVIEGHTDSTGTEKVNMRLSEERARAAYKYFVEKEKLPSSRFVVKWYGESMPLASNETPEGREINRRVEIRGQVLEVEKADLLDQVRGEQEVTVDSVPVEVDTDGRFHTQVQDPEADHLNIEMTDTTGKKLESNIPVPTLQITDPQGEVRLPYGLSSDRYKVGMPGPDGEWKRGETALIYILKGRTEPGNSVELDKRSVPVGPDGSFRTELALRMQETNLFSLLVKNPAGFTRIASVRINVADTDDDGRLVVIRDPIPNLSVHLPPEGTPFYNTLLEVPGATDPGNRVLLNGLEVEVHPDGGFLGRVELSKGENLVRISVIDPDGYTGAIERKVVLSEKGLFFMAFADGEIGLLQGKGYLEGAGMDKKREFYQEGRVAYYLKGTIAGKYLITSAFDSGTGEFGDLFKDLDEGRRDRFFANLDPDKLYPVYGDASSLTYDAQSQGKFFLALTAEEFSLLVGNYSLNMSDTELSAYQRTLYGGKFTYRSLSETKYGDPDTTVLLFGAQIRYAHVRDELRGTGGSLYYLSRRNIIEGSDEVAILIRDKNTNMIRARIPLRRDADYQIKYEEGRVLLSKPLSSVVQDDLIIDDDLLSGSPVSLQVDYEVKADALEKTSSGGRVRKQIGDSLAVGGTYIDDELESGRYKLTGLDAELRLGSNSRISGEYANSSGSDSPVYVSDDGGLTFTRMPDAPSVEGIAWKTAAHLDIGELFGKPEGFEVGGYIKRLEPGFQSNENAAEEGMQSTGAGFKFTLTSSDTMSGRYDRQTKIDSASLSPGMENETRTSTLQWIHKRENLGITLEYRADESEDNTGETLKESRIGAGRLDLTHSDRMSSYLEHQQSLSGPENDQTSLGTSYRVNDVLSLKADGTHGTLGDSAQGRADFDLGDSSLYITDRTSRDSDGSKKTTAMGTETSTGPSGKVYTENQWESSDDGTDRQINLVGVENGYDIARGLKAHMSGEASKVESETGTLNRHALSVGLSYRRDEGLAASIKGEVRKENGSENRVQYLTANRLEVSLSPDYSLLGRYDYSITRDLDLNEIEARFEEKSIGLAYRPVKSDRLNLLARFTLLSDQGPDSLLEEMEFEVTDTRVASIEWSYDFTPRLEWVEKDALKVKEEKTGDRSPVKTHTSLSIHRLNYNFAGDFDLGVEYRIKRVNEADDQQVGWLTELMYRMGKHMRLGVGFNFTDFSDDEFSENDYSVRGLFIRVQGKY